jgi:chemotaxis methyl-accepting protein methylase
MPELFTENDDLPREQVGSACRKPVADGRAAGETLRLKHVFFGGVASPPARVCRSEPSRRRIEAALPAAEADFLAPLFQMAGLPAEAYRGAALARRLPACLRLLRVRSLAEASRAIAARREWVPEVLNVVLLGVTEFFRDQNVFAELRDRVLPQLPPAAEGRRIWSAACSEGHELYSVAMLLAEAGGLEGGELLGTDCRADAIEQARRGVFAREALARLEPRWRERYFVARGSAMAIDARLRAAASWRTGDLLERVEPGPWHLILWRNMAIYLREAPAAAIWTRLCDELAPGGFLVAGKADYPPKRLPLKRVSACIFQKIEM